MQMTEEMFQTMFSVRSLKDAECAKDFDCGDEDLNEFITKEAGLYKDAVPFYLKNGFIPLTSKDADSYTELLYYDLFASKS